MTDADTPASLAAAELQRARQYVQIGRLNLRIEYLMLGALFVFACGLAIGFFFLDIGEDEITGKWGYPALWLISLLRSASVLIPMPGGGLTIIAGGVMDPVLGIPAPIMVGITAGTAESIGEFTGYFAGMNGGRLIEERRIYQRVAGWVQKRAFTTMLLMAMMPAALFDVAGLAAGATRIPIRVFYPAILIGKVSRGIVMATLGYVGVEFLHRFL